MRLTDVETFNGATMVADYRLAYQQSSVSNRSQMTSVTLCAAAGVCLPATSFAWQSGAGSATFAGQTQTLPNGWLFKSGMTYIPIIGDFNGDGKTDYLMIGSNGYPYQYVFINNGDGTFTGQTQTLPNGWNFQVDGNTPATNFSIVGDFNGDGKTDYLLIDSNGYPYQYVFIDNGSMGDLLNTITTGLGATTAITYQPLTNNGIYSKDNNASYPVQDMQSALYVVSRVDSSNGLGGTYSSTYFYAGAKLDLSGRGFLGFRQTSSSDLQTGIVQTSNYGLTFPYIGLLTSTTKSLNAQTLNQATSSYQFSNASGAATLSSPSNNSAPYRVSVAQSVSSSFDLDGSKIPPATTSYQYDAYGNATQVVVSTPDGFSKTTANTYTNDTTHWWLGRLTAATVTSVAP